MKEARRPGKTAHKEDREKRSRKRREAMRKRLVLTVGAIVIAVVLVVVLLCYFLGVFDKIPEQSRLTIDGKGAVICQEVSEFDKKLYDKNNLKVYLKQEINTYNDEHGSDSVRLETFKIKDDMAYAQTVYTSPAVYSDFTGFLLYQGTVEKAREEGYDFSDAFVAVEDGEKADSVKTLDVTSQPKLKVVIIKENISVTVDGKILYVSDSNTTMVSEDTVSISQVDGNQDATQLTYIFYQ